LTQISPSSETFQAAFVPIYPAHTYRRTPPNLFNLTCSSPDVAMPFLQIVSQPTASCPAEGVYFIESCHIYEAKYILLDGGEWLSQTVVDLGIADQLLPVLRDVISGNHARALERHADPTVVIAKAGAANYGHVLAEILPKIINIKRLGLARIRLLIPVEMGVYIPVVTDLLRAVGIHAELRIMQKGELLSAEAIYFFSAVSRHDSRKSQTFLELRAVLAQLYGNATERDRRLFVQRGPNDGRKLTNTEQVEAVFARYGYQSIYPVSLSLPDQIRLFSSASHVAGSLGAGLSNIAFAPTGCEVAMIDPGLGDFFFWDFACLVGHRFTWLFAGPLRGYTEELARSDFAYDIPILESNLRFLYG